MPKNKPALSQPTANQNDEMVRLEKLKKIRAAGINPYPDKFDVSETLAEAKAKKEGTEVTCAGRLLTLRDMGKLTFAHLQDFSGKMQIILKGDELGEENYQFLLKTLDLGDYLGVSGKIFITHKGEISILVNKCQLLAKALLPLPEKWHGLQDTEAKYRQRYLDLISNRETLDRFIFRSNLIKKMREFYWANGFIEVETPILGNTASGALAKPFKTHHEALDLPLYLRIAPETFLKEAIVGGFERVFEIGRSFRNEGIDPSHLQDFTTVEHYAAYWNYEDNMKFTEKMLGSLLTDLLGTLKLEILNRDGEKIKVDFTPPYPRVTFRELIKKDSGIDIDKLEKVEDLRTEIKKKKIDIEDLNKLGRGNLIDELYKKVSRPKLVGPVFLIQHPTDVSPLSRRNDQNPKVVDRFQLVIVGWEVTNAYSELVDPLDQEGRFTEQASLKKAGDAEAHGKDDDYVTAMKYGMPPMSGLGLGIDRLVALLTQQPNLKDVVLFPLMKPKE